MSADCDKVDCSNCGANWKAIDYKITKKGNVKYTCKGCGHTWKEKRW